MAQFSIYKASAGSGKTFRLVVEYVKLLLKNPHGYKHILAVTFTNKATNEMKERVLRDLYSISVDKNPGLIEVIEKETEMKKQEIISNAKLSLSLILHDYDRFSISTIDSFFQKVLRSFARESGLFGSYEVDLDQDAAIMEACDLMLLSVENDPQLRKWLLAMSEESLEEGKGWQIKDKLLRIGREIEKEEFIVYRMQMSNLEEERLKLDKLRNELLTTRRWFESQCRKLGEEGIGLIDQFDLSLGDFSYKSSSFANTFYKLKNHPIDKINLGKRLFDALDNLDKWSNNIFVKPRVEALYHAGLNETIRKIINLFEMHEESYCTANEIYKNIYALGVLSTLAHFVREVGKEKNSLLIRETDTLLKGIIDNNDAPFVYEKIGNAFQHFMIDEFQDTSNIQWDNFRPLIVNSLSQHYSNMVVGDVKQSIYRWRNSNWHLLAQQIKDELNIFGISEKNLEHNWRSRENIVHFNNAFFKQSSTKVQDLFNSNFTGNSVDDSVLLPENKIIEELYADVVQISASGKKDGKVFIKIITNEEKVKYISDTVEAVIQAIKEVQDKGGKASDIAILVRKNRVGKLLAEALMIHQKKEEATKYNFEVISNDSIFIESSLSVRFLVAFFRFIATPWDLVNQAYLLFSFNRYILPKLIELGKQPASLLFNDVQKPYDDNAEEGNDYLFDSKIQNEFFPFFNEPKQSTILKSWSNLSINDLITEISIKYNLIFLPGEQAGLQSFRDVVHDFCKLNDGSLHKFIDWWDVKGGNIKIQTSTERDAVRIVTIHKSKGLEFPVVIIPFCDWELAPPAIQSILWCKPDKDIFKEFPLLPLKFSKNLLKTSYRSSYITENLLSYIDNLNLLYVALTRAVDGLYIFTSSESKGNTIQNIVKAIVDDKQTGIIADTDNENTYSFGDLNFDNKTQFSGSEIDLSVGEGVKADIGKTLRLHKNFEGFFDIGQETKASRLNQGRIIHDILSQIQSVGDLDNVLKKLFIEGKIDMEKKAFWADTIHKMVENPIAIDWFTDRWKVLNEATILSPDFNLKRPDRVMVSDNAAIVVDYKATSIRSIKHKKQVEEYVDKIKKMGVENVFGYVWYLTDNAIVNIVEGNFENN
jgi:ATP-dependent helicase/nuclease subunit A